MKGIPIKFRGKDKHGQTVYFTLKPEFGSLSLWTSPRGSYHGEVDEKSLVQLVGYDADGTEVYEGDKIFDAEHNDTLIAEIYPGVHLNYYHVIKENEE